MSIPLGLYQHFKGAYYYVLELAKHSETEEDLVVYRALYGQKGVWVRPLSMFTETVEREGIRRPRFAYLKTQACVMENIVFEIKPGQESLFETAFTEARMILKPAKGYISDDFQKCIENTNRYFLSVRWHTFNDCRTNLRTSFEYTRFLRSLQHFFRQPPVVESFISV